MRDATQNGKKPWRQASSIIVMLRQPFLLDSSRIRTKTSRDFVSGGTFITIYLPNIHHETWTAIALLRSRDSLLVICYSCSLLPNRSCSSHLFSVSTVYLVALYFSCLKWTSSNYPTGVSERKMVSIFLKYLRQISFIRARSFLTNQHLALCDGEYFLSRSIRLLSFLITRKYLQPVLGEQSERERSSKKVSNRTQWRWAVSSRKLDGDFGIFRESVRRILTNDLGCQAYRCLTKAMLIDEQNVKWAQLANWIRTHFQKKTP